MEKLERRWRACILWHVETVEYQGYRLSRHAAELAEREGIDVGLIDRNLRLSPKERLRQAQLAAAASMRMIEAGKRYRNER